MNYRSNKTTCTALLAAACLTLVGAPTAAQQQTQPGQQRPGQPRPGQDQPLRTQQGQYHRGQDHKPFTTETFLKEAAQCNMMAKELGQMANQKSDNSEVKEFAQTLIQDHGKVQERIASLAKKHNVTLPKQWEGKQQQEVQRFQSLTGEQFNWEFAKAAVKGHAKEINQFEKAARQSTDQDVQSWARQHLATLRQHMQEAREMAKAVGLDEATITSLIRDIEGVGTPGAGVEIETGTEKNKDLQDRDTENRDKTKDQPK